MFSSSNISEIESIRVGGSIILNIYLMNLSLVEEDIMKTEEEKVKEISRDLIERIAAAKIVSGRKLDYEKRRLSKEYNIVRILKNSEILFYAKKHEREKVRLLVKKPVRSISGVSVVAVMSKPASCPGKCIYCPQGENAPKSYTGLEPAARRGAMFAYDPYLQAKDRIKQLTAIGHATDKVELIIMGGTFLSYSLDYKMNFVKRLFDALNQLDDLLCYLFWRTRISLETILSDLSCSLEHAQGFRDVDQFHCVCENKAKILKSLLRRNKTEVYAIFNTDFLTL